jgi:XTP/dITP diphosphohydrolase
MKEFIFASSNSNKAEEIEAALPPGFIITIMKKAGITEDIPEPYLTLEENSKHKAQFVFAKLGKDCFAEDTGLEVEALDGEPGVKSARYAGDGRDFGKNIDKLLSKMNGKDNRRARFRTVFTLIFDGIEYQFEGICTGTITEKPSGTGGFGYDGVFLADNCTTTFAEMELAEKNKYSHRKKALDKMIQFLAKNE